MQTSHISDDTFNTATPLMQCLYWLSTTRPDIAAFKQTILSLRKMNEQMMVCKISIRSYNENFHLR